MRFDWHGHPASRARAISIVAFIAALSTLEAVGAMSRVQGNSL
jgi:hypothetical protein